MNFLWLAEQAWSAVIYFWPISLGALAFFAAALFFTRRALLKIPPRSWLLLTSPLLVPPIILLWASIMRHSDAHTPAPDWPSYVLNAFLSVAVIFFGFVIWRAAGLRFVASAFVLCSAWLSLCATFVGGMALTNDWL